MVGRVVLFAGLFACGVFAQNSDDCDIAKLVKVTVQTNPSPSLPGQAVAIRVFVDPVQGAVLPTGEVELFDGPADLGALPLVQAQAATTQTFAVAGAHVLRGTYSG